MADLSASADISFIGTLQLIAFIEFVALCLIAAISLFAVLDWIKRKHPRWTAFAAFIVACGAAYSASFALDMILGAIVGIYRFSPLTVPVFTWSSIAIALHLFARYVSVRRVWIGVPYFAFGGLAIIGGLLSPHKYDMGVGLPLILFATIILLREEKSKLRTTGKLPDDARDYRQSDSANDRAMSVLGHVPVVGAMLIIADDAERGLLESALRAEGYGVVSVRSGQEGLNLLKEEQFHLVLLDVDLPGYDGMALLRAIRAHYPELPIIITIQHGTIEDAIRAVRGGATDYIAKPWQNGRLLSAVRAAIRESSHSKVISTKAANPFLGCDRSLTEAQIRKWKQVIAGDPNDYETLAAIGAAYGKLGEHETAVMYFNKAIAVSPSYAEAYVGLGSACGFLGRRLQAIAALRKAVSLDPKNALAYLKLGTTLGKAGQYPEAVAQLKEAVRLGPDLTDAHFALGLAYFSGGDRASAMQEVGALSRIDPPLASQLQQIIGSR